MVNRAWHSLKAIGQRLPTHIHTYTYKQRAAHTSCLAHTFLDTPPALRSHSRTLLTHFRTCSSNQFAFPCEQSALL